jgi:glyoxylase-like metal-dependent hydrolase (beta-lactamase superfamily II)
MPVPAPRQTVQIGDIRVTYLPDGGGALAATALFPGTTAEEWRHYTQFLNDEGGVITTLGGYLIETADRRLIVDTGLGPVHLDFPGFGPMDGGTYLDNFRATGIAAEEVTDVFFTHMHLDHVGWTTIEEDGARRLLFPNARYLVGRTEWGIWYGGDSPVGPHPEYVQKPLADRITFVTDGDEIAPGVVVVATPGHTKGHLSLIVRSQGERLVITADLFTCPVQVKERTWTIAFDMDPEQAIASRAKMYPELTRADTLAAVNHFADTVFGRFTEQNGDYTWTPLTLGG